MTAAEIVEKLRNAGFKVERYDNEVSVSLKNRGIHTQEVREVIGTANVMDIIYLEHKAVTVYGH